MQSNLLMSKLLTGTAQGRGTCPG